MLLCYVLILISNLINDDGSELYGIKINKKIEDEDEDWTK